MQEVMGARVQNVTVRGLGMLGWGWGAAGMSLYFHNQAERCRQCHAFQSPELQGSERGSQRV